MDALTELAKWDRKYYRYKIENGGHIMPGDGLCVTLEAGGRKVFVDETDLPEDATIGDVILEALRKWHEDDTPKHYQAYWTHEKNQPTPVPHEGMNCKQWTENMIQAAFIAKNEAEALQKVQSLYPPDANIGRIAIYEVRR